MSRRKEFDQASLRQAAEDYRAGRAGLEELARRLQTCAATTASRLRSMGVTIRSQGAHKGSSWRKRSHAVPDARHYGSRTHPQRMVTPPTHKDAYVSDFIKAQTKAQLMSGR